MVVLGWWDRGRLVGGGVRWEMRRGFGKVNRGGGGGGRRSHGGGKKVSGRWWVSLSSLLLRCRSEVVFFFVNLIPTL